MISTSELEWRYCADCARLRPFEAPACVDGHDADCPDLACTVCGDARTVSLQPLRRPRVIARVAA